MAIKWTPEDYINVIEKAMLPPKKRPRPDINLLMKNIEARKGKTFGTKTPPTK